LRKKDEFYLQYKEHKKYEWGCQTKKKRGSNKEKWDRPESAITLHGIKDPTLFLK
jgi:hypothetical protein